MSTDANAHEPKKHTHVMTLDPMEEEKNALRFPFQANLMLKKTITLIEIDILQIPLDVVP